MSDDNQIYDSLKNEVVWLFAKRAIYTALYEQNESRLELLIETAPVFSTLFQKMLLDEMSIIICRILDPKQTGRHENNTLFQLIGDNHSCFGELQSLSEKVEPIRQQRNKFLAHRDLDKTLEQFTANTKSGTTSFDLNFPISMQELDDILNKIQMLLNRVGDANLQYGLISTPLGPDLGVKKFVDTLKAGVFFNKLSSEKHVDFLDFIKEWEEYKFKDA